MKATATDPDLSFMRVVTLLTYILELPNHRGKTLSFRIVFLLSFFFVTTVCQSLIAPICHLISYRSFCVFPSGLSSQKLTTPSDCEI